MMMEAIAEQRRLASNAKANRWYHANKDQAQAATQKWQREHPEQYRAICRASVLKARAKNPRVLILRNIAQNSKKKGLPFDLVETDLIWPSHCPVLGMELVYIATGRRLSGSASIDRFDNRIGYVKGNVRVISWRANNLKADATLEELHKIVAYMQGAAP